MGRIVNVAISERFSFDLEDVTIIPPQPDQKDFHFTSGAADPLSAVPEGKRLEVVVHTTEQDFKGRLTTWPAVRTFLWGGNAVFTLRSGKTGMRYTYQVKAKKADVVAKLPDVTYFVALLRGPDNASDWRYVGVLRKPAQFNLTSNSKVARSAESVKTLLWFLDKMARERDVLTGDLEFWHSGRCGRCGKVLTVPESVASGIGPTCSGKGRL